jgi:hypothetical protein
MQLILQFGSPAKEANISREEVTKKKVYADKHGKLLTRTANGAVQSHSTKPCQLANILMGITSRIVDLVKTILNYALFGKLAVSPSVQI